MSGFDGSAGTLVVTADPDDGGTAALWTDGRYYLQAGTQLSGSGIELMRDGMPDTPDIPGYLSQVLSKLASRPGSAEGGSATSGAAAKVGATAKVGAAAECISLRQARSLAQRLSQHNLQLELGPDVIDTVWPERPGIPSAPVRDFPGEAAGESRRERLTRVRSIMREQGIDTLLVGSLDDLAYLFLLRGEDVAYNPVSVGYAIIEQDRCRVYLPPAKHGSAGFLAADGIELCPYDAIQADVASFPEGTTVAVDPDRTNAGLWYSLPDGVDVREQVLPSIAMKSCKNPVEITNIRQAMRTDGAAMVRFLRWVKEHPAVEELDELEAAEQLRRIRAKHPAYMGDSFPAIAGFGPNGAIVHYAVTPESSRPFSREGLFLIDSGAHYAWGTTDITRVVCWDSPSQAVRRDYTLVLKGHIALATARFPRGTRGIQLDTLARRSLWQNGLDYRHGTGHGVGYCLPVHEGPQSISTRMVDTALQPGMLTSNEPGLYRDGAYGIRLENLILTMPDSQYQDFLCFETLTLCPFERDLIDVSLLNQNELNWIDRYHDRVLAELQGLVDGADRAFLTRMCSPLAGPQETKIRSAHHE